MLADDRYQKVQAIATNWEPKESLRAFHLCFKPQ